MLSNSYSKINGEPKVTSSILISLHNSRLIPSNVVLNDLNFLTIINDQKDY